jgi:hypothetical protein
MTRYFFDVNAEASVQYDYKGRYLSSLEQAQQMAELIALDLGCTGEGKLPTMEVQIRSAGGSLLGSVPVKLMAA